MMRFGEFYNRKQYMFTLSKSNNCSISPNNRSRNVFTKIHVARAKGRRPNYIGCKRYNTEVCWLQKEWAESRNELALISYKLLRVFYSAVQAIQATNYSWRAVREFVNNKVVLAIP